MQAGFLPAIAALYYHLDKQENLIHQTKIQIFC